MMTVTGAQSRVFPRQEGHSVGRCDPGDIALADQPDDYPQDCAFQAGHRFLSRLLEDLA